MKKLNLFHLFILCVAVFCLTACEKEDLNDTKETTKPVTAKLIVTYTGDTTMFSSKSYVYAIDAHKLSRYSVFVDNKEDFHTGLNWAMQGNELPTLNKIYLPSTVLDQKQKLISRTYYTYADIACFGYYEDFSQTVTKPNYRKEKSGDINVNIKTFIKDKLVREVTYIINLKEPKAWIIFYSDKSFADKRHEGDGLHNENDDNIHFNVVVDN